MNSSEEESQDPLSQQSDPSPYLESSGPEIDAVFAGNLSANLKRVEEAFGVTLITRDSWIRIESGEGEKIRAAKSFLEHLFHLHSDTRRPLRQMDFDLALKAYKAIDGEGFARVDFFVDKDSGQIYFNEMNTIPGFTSISMYPFLWESRGLSVQNLVERLIRLAFAREKER